MKLATLVAVSLLAGCQTNNQTATVQDKGTLPTGDPVHAYVLTNSHGMKAKILNLGGVLQELDVPDAKGQPADVVLGFDNVADYAKPTGIYFGAIVGRYANRIANGKFELDGKTYHLPINNGPNSLHGGNVGFDKRIWDGGLMQTFNGPAVKLTLTSRDGDQGYPGTLNATVVYTLTDDNELKIDYTATTDKPTVLNLTNHSYFNLTGDPSHNTVKYHVVTIDADKYTPVNSVQIPTGIAPVEGTPFDFKSPHIIGERLAQTGGKPYGYDHNYVLNGGQTDEPRKVVTVSEPLSGRVMEVWTTQPGVQFYTANFLDGKIAGKAGVKYEPYTAFCFETQHFPDSPNQPQFPTTVLRPGETFHSTTIYKFR